MWQGKRRSGHMQASGFWTRERLDGCGLIPSSMPLLPNPHGPRDVAGVLDAALAKTPDAPALIDRFGQLSYADLDAAANALAAAFVERGIGEGERIAGCATNHNELVIAFLASQRIGAVWVGINRALALPEMKYVIEDSGAALFLCPAVTAAAARGWIGEGLRHVMSLDPGDPGSDLARAIEQHRGAPRPAVTIDPWAPAGIAYTSGTTGFPKGVVHSQHNMMVTATISVEYSGDGVPETVRGTALPLTILNCMILGPLAALSTGAPHVNLDRIDALGVAEWIGAERIANISLVPTLIQDLLTNPDIDQEQLSSLRWLVVGGSAVPQALPQLYRQRFGRRMTVGYGLTEGPNGVAKTHEGSPEGNGVIGRPLPHLHLAILDEAGNEVPHGETGEIAIRAIDHGPWAGVYKPTLGYWNRPEATAKLLRGGWVCTGDVGMRDASGEFFIRDRGSDLILRGGANVYPAEVERVLRMDAQVRDCAVVGRPHARLGQSVAAFIEVEGLSALEEQMLLDRLRELCATNLAAYKAPKDWVVLPAMPRNAMGKIVKTQLVAMVAQTA
jgi:Acyl-CoA synthetases (AMP-forming)/AMP-acid ligases II